MTSPDDEIRSHFDDRRAEDAADAPAFSTLLEQRRSTGERAGVRPPACWRGMVGSRRGGRASSWQR